MNQWPFGVTSAQQDFIRVLTGWRCDVCPQGVRKTAFDPGAARRHLSQISILERGPNEALRFRYIGSGVSRLLETVEPLSPLEQVPPHMAAAWTGRIDEILRQPGLLCGFDRRGGAPLGHAWLRVPMTDESGCVVQILCHDAVESEPTLERRDTVNDDIHGEDIELAA